VANKKYALFPEQQGNTKTATLNTIRSHIDKLISKDIIPDIILIDYLDLIKVSSHYEQRRYELESLVEECRALGQEYRCPIVVPTQTNKIGFNSEIITITDASEAFSKTFAADVVLTFNRKKDGKSDDFSNIGNVFIAKSRLGKDNILFPMIIDTGTSTIVLGEPKKFNDPEIKKENEIAHNTQLKEAFNEWKADKK
jgi:hypothetical protein